MCRAKAKKHPQDLDAMGLQAPNQLWDRPGLYVSSRYLRADRVVASHSFQTTHGVIVHADLHGSSVFRVPILCSPCIL